MILDIKLTDGWSQFWYVRKISTTIAGEDEPDFKMIVWFYDDMYPKMTIALANIDEFTVTND